MGEFILWPHSVINILPMTPPDLPTISVVIPTLNEAQNIGKLLAALQAQEYSGSLQIIVVDGNSDDGTPNIISQCAGVLLLQTPRGVSHQRNAGAQKATGELLVFMDADDFPQRQFLQKVAQSYRRFPFAVACPWFVARDSGFAARAMYVFFNLLFSLSQSTLRTGSGVCIITPKTVWGKVGGFDEDLHLGEDVKFIRSASPRCGFHRHLWIPLETSGRRFQEKGAGRLMLFYARITPLILLSQWKTLRKIRYEAAPYSGDK